MALEMNDILALKGMGKEDNGMTPYEQFRMAVIKSIQKINLI